MPRSSARKLIQATPALAIAAVSSAAVLTLGGRPLDPVTAAGVFPPWWSGGRALAAAGSAGDVLGVGALPFIVVVRAPHADARLRAAGALFSIDARGAGACSKRTSSDV
ncbi:MAG TPA: hypothetical protein VG939_22500 [Caulobacteraceae bacterium]|nr:hypothetical protein [Caulobacteraceae bacterium]